jgi:hypothetical protein
MQTLFDSGPIRAKPTKKRIVAKRVENNAGVPLCGDPHCQWGIPCCQGHILDVSGLARFNGFGRQPARRPRTLPKGHLPAYSNGQASSRKNLDLSAYREDLAILADPRDRVARYRSTRSHSMRGGTHRQIGE